MSSPGGSGTRSAWDLRALARAPEAETATDFTLPDVRALFFDSLPWKGKPTRVFAYLGLPTRRTDENVPGIVLVHGGGGTAFVEWVRLWTSRGYAAIAMAHSGNLPVREIADGPYIRDAQAGPEGYGGFNHIDFPREDQWTYHAVANVILAHSLLSAQPEVDSARIGITGISWGGFLTCIAAGVDARFRFAVPVYGCGFLTENTFISPHLDRIGPDRTEKWRQIWDPSGYLAGARMPFLWMNGTNDPFPLNALQKSYRLAPGRRTLCIPVRMIHGHGGPGENPAEIHVFADSCVQTGNPLARITGQRREGRRASVTFATDAPISRAELNYTMDSGAWTDRTWHTGPAALLSATQAAATLPERTTAFYFNLTDSRNLVVSSEHIDLAS